MCSGGELFSAHQLQEISALQSAAALMAACLLAAKVASTTHSPRPETLQNAKRATSRPLPGLRQSDLRVGGRSPSFVEQRARFEGPGPEAHDPGQRGEGGGHHPIPRRSRLGVALAYRPGPLVLAPRALVAPRRIGKGHYVPGRTRRYRPAKCQDSAAPAYRPGRTPGRA
jgi:hypothetical protein